MNASDTVEIDVAVVGGGVSGAYAAWRLVEPGRPLQEPLRQLASPDGRLNVHMYERSDRIGGRLHTVTPKDTPHLHAEVGGMRFPTVHRFVVSLVDALGLAWHDFADGDLHNFYYLRGKRLSASDLRDAQLLPYFLRPEEQGRDPVEMLLAVMRHLLPDGLDISPAAWEVKRRTLQVDGTALHDLGFWNVAARCFSNEALGLIRDAFGYDSSLGNWNASDVMTLAITHRGQGPLRYRALDDGFQALPLTLVRQFEARGGVVHCRHRLRGLNVEPDGRLRLRFETSANEASSSTVLARHVILAMPRRALSLLEQDCFLFDHPQFVADLQAVVGQPACKLFLGYREPWWTPMGLRSGRSVTDLPMRQCYYWGTEGDQQGADPSNRCSLLMAGYNDGASVDYWRGFLGPRADGTLAERLPGGEFWQESLEAPAAMLDDIRRQLQEMHGDAVRVPEPISAMFVDWEEDPYGGAWHGWRIQEKSWEVMPRMRQPVAGVGVYVCGEAWSTDQGWVQGALHTAELVLEEKLGLGRPCFLPADAVPGLAEVDVAAVGAGISKVSVGIPGPSSLSDDAEESPALEVMSSETNS